MNLQIIYQLEDERGAFLFKQQLRGCFGSILLKNSNFFNRAKPLAF